MVDGYTRDGWWTGKVIRVMENDGGKKYTVYYDNVSEEIDFDRSELRLHREWVEGKWIVPQKQKVVCLNFLIIICC